jgi:hypothetical protein
VTGAFWSWVAAQVHNAPYLCLFSWLPLALTWLLFHKATSLNAKFVGFNEYLMKVEDAFIRDGGAWEHFLKTGNLGLIPNVYSGVFYRRQVVSLHSGDYLLGCPQWLLSLL